MSMQGEAAKEEYLTKYRAHYYPEEQLEFLGSLGSGTYADVYHCILRNGRTEQQHVAVKKMKPELLASETDVLDFFRETDVLAGARETENEYILEFIGVTVGAIERDTMESLCIVEEYMNHGTLKSLIEVSRCNAGGVSRKQMLRLMLQVAHGLSFLHMYQASVIHRDIKPSNILVNKDAETGVFIAKLADFGLNVLVLEHAPPNDPGPSNRESGASGSKNGMSRAPSLIRSLTGLQRYREAFVRARAEQRFRKQSLRQAQVVGEAMPQFYALTGQTGSRAYMAPEVHLEQKYNHKADIFSFGIVLFEAISHVHPYIHYLIDTRQFNRLQTDGSMEDDLADYANAVAQDNYRSKLRDIWPAELSKLIAECWSQNVQERPSIAEVVARLEDIYENCTTEEVFQSKCKCLSCLWPSS